MQIYDGVAYVFSLRLRPQCVVHDAPFALVHDGLGFDADVGVHGGRCNTDRGHGTEVLVDSNDDDGGGGCDGDDGGDVDGGKMSESDGGNSCGDGNGRKRTT